jgi:geranylgeranyl transferase type-2 subunit alpha
MTPTWVFYVAEFEFVRTALWTNPDDQSSWLYHRWLVGPGKLNIVRQEIANIQELLEEEPDSRCELLKPFAMT